MYDGAELARTIVSNPSEIDTALALYEKELFPRSAKIARASAKNLQRFFDETAPRGTVDLFEGFRTQLRGCSRDARDHTKLRPGRDYCLD